MEDRALRVLENKVLREIVAPEIKSRNGAENPQRGYS
jgi:hypothetical protein